MASTKIPWQRLWTRLWKMIPNPLTEGRLLLATDDSINPKTGKNIFACYKFFDHAAKQNQSRYPWSQNIVTTGLLKVVKGRWACLPLSFRFYHLKQDLKNRESKIGKNVIEFQSKMDQTVEMISEIATEFDVPVISVTDSWFGNNGLMKPLRKALGFRFHMLSRLRSNNNLFDLPTVEAKRRAGRPRKYGKKLGNTSSLAAEYKPFTKEYTVNLYGNLRTIVAYDQIVMLKTLKCPARVIWVYRKTQWVALFTTELTLSVEQIIEYYGARWKIESGFKELKQDIGSAHTQTRNPFSVMNHLNFCMMSSTFTWIYASHLEKIPSRRHSVKERASYAFSDVRRLVAKEALDNNFNRLFPVPKKSTINSLVSCLLRIAA